LGTPTEMINELVNGGLCTGDSDRCNEWSTGDGASLSMGALLGEPGGGGSFSDGQGLSWANCLEPIHWGLRDMVERGSGGGVSLNVGDLGREPGRGAPLLGPLRICG
jgi:hypothetical protein